MELEHLGHPRGFWRFTAAPARAGAMIESAVSTDPALRGLSCKLCPRCHSIYPASTQRCAREGELLVDDERILAGKFILVRKIGEGSMGAVYQAEQPQIGRTVAVKILRPDPEFMMRFEREVQ